MIQMTKAMDEGYANYKQQNPCVSEYMEVDFKAGFRRGYEAAKADSDLRERAAIAAMQGILASLDHPYDSDTYIKEMAQLAVRQADALVKELNRQQP